MIAHDLFVPSPLLVLSSGTMLMLVSIAWRRSITLSLSIGLLTLLLALAGTDHHLTTGQHGVATLFIQDRWADYTTALILLSSICILGLSWRNLLHDTAHPTDEYPLLLLLGTLGATSMVFSANYIPFFLGLEILGISLIGLVAARHHHLTASSEASMKYLILSGISSAILLFGIGLAYAATGSLYFSPPVATDGISHGIPIAAATMILVGIFFKLSAVPFHMWIPDVMEGASTPVAAFIAVVSKIAIFSSLVRYFSAGEMQPFLNDTMTAVIILTILGGNLLALRQTSLTRLMACSSIAHVGYLLMAFLSPGQLQSGAIVVYLAAYTASTLGVFSVISALAANGDTDGTSIADWKGLFFSHPFLAVIMSLMLLSLAGIPPGIGFFAKFEIAAASVERQRDLLLAALVIGSVIGLYYYLNVIRTMMTPDIVQIVTYNRKNYPELTGLALVLTIIVIVGGLFPARLIRPILPAPVTIIPRSANTIAPDIDTAMRYAIHDISP
ncbi:NADH-quinone oxidoreductase subunit N [Acetobacter fallax]|uniref:NADH-quinone oxidoreductase subunit N n=1 Tax=Acetobacter fallax TaxID=1737473 RepID=A0ABX0KCH5_9PROT|nr:NADH-quinone oxidoreductase subunit N [Acetobacter fallax]NHO33695.1 NADH-quinone oxidoreductase subunit N [Acetobacter fallax]NHO36482.1 NADH-quinone oxidoreductase subunit N [Acetobacter fallax]